MTSRQGVEHEHRLRHAREGGPRYWSSKPLTTHLDENKHSCGWCGPSLRQTVRAQPTQSSELLVAEGSGCAAAMRAQIGPSFLLLIQVTNFICVCDLPCKTKNAQAFRWLSEEKGLHTSINTEGLAHMLEYTKLWCMYYSRRGGCATTDARCSFLICPHLLPCTMIAPVVLSPGTKSPCVTSSNPAAAMPSWSEKE